MHPVAHEIEIAAEDDREWSKFSNVFFPMPRMRSAFTRHFFLGTRSFEYSSVFKIRLQASYG